MKILDTYKTTGPFQRDGEVGWAIPWADDPHLQQVEQPASTPRLERAPVRPPHPPGPVVKSLAFGRPPAVLACPVRPDERDSWRWVE